MNIELLDLARRRVSFSQSRDANGAPDWSLDWVRLSSALSDSNPHVIDVGSLENRQHNAQFMVSEVRRRMTAGGPEPVCALIVLSGPMTFEKGEDLSPIPTAGKPNCQVFYIRYSALNSRPQGMTLGIPRLPPQLGRGSGTSLPPTGVVISDTLERTLKPLDPRLFDVTAPAEFRKALASILTEIARQAN